MPRHRFQIVNVFAESPLGGNPLCVFEDGRGIDPATMQALALQFNLSETTFVLPSTAATAAVRIFSPAFEMPFAGHPTLGTAHVVRERFACGDEVTLAMKVGLVRVTAAGDRWTLTAAQAPRYRPATATRAQLAEALGLDAADIAGEPLWVDTGSDQLVIPIATPAAVHRARPHGTLLEERCGNGQRAMAYLWARSGADTALVRFFFPKYGAVCEDPGTGSACANLGGYLLATHQPRPLRWTLSQGQHVGRPCSLTLEVDAAGAIHVGGRVVALGRGEIELPEK